MDQKKIHTNFYVPFELKINSLNSSTNIFSSLQAKYISLWALLKENPTIKTNFMRNHKL